MRKAATVLIIIAVVALAMLVSPGRVCAQEVRVQDLIDNGEQYDGTTVTIEGEAIGDIMLHGDYAWITVNDDPYITQEAQEQRIKAGYNIGISVWVSKVDAERITVLGGYKNVGDRVAVTGIFRRVDHEHGGNTDIVAENLIVLEKGQPISHPSGVVRWILLGALAVIALSLWRILRTRRLLASGRAR